VCDIEGGERDLLDIDRVPALRNVDVLVEVHENLAPGVGASIERRFGSTHEIRKLVARQRCVDDKPPQVELPPQVVQTAMDELRYGGLDWYWMLAKDHG
jgi:hypothetical protein